MNCHSIFNDVLGPVMAGPSSSHSAGCARIGRMARLLWGSEIKKAVVVYDSQGSYPSTCVGQGSNFGFTGGLLGFANDDPRMKDSIRIAKEEGVEISFREEVLSARHPNEARIDIYKEDGTVGCSVLTLSVGGGMFRIVEMDGFPVSMDGSREQLYLYAKAEDRDSVKRRIQQLADDVSEIRGTDPDAGILFCMEGFGARGLAAAAEEAARIPEVTGVRKAEVVLPIAVKKGEHGIFSTAAEALRYGGGEKRMWELALDYECSIGEASREEIWRQAEHTLDVMKKAAEPPDPQKEEMFGFLPYQCADMIQSKKQVRTVNTGCLEKAMFYAIAVMENSCAHNIVTASPTAGSGGVVPAAVVAAGEEMGCTREEIVKGLLAAGIAGAFIANQATFGAEVAGCQAENGAASAMAAAGVTELLGGTPEQGFRAASMALQNMLGLICDPVGGLTEIPCISRNVAAMSNAVMSANMAMLGFDPVIPYDETIRTMYEVGQMLPAELRCTCGGGLCTTKTGSRIAEQLKHK